MASELDVWSQTPFPGAFRPLVNICSSSVCGVGMTTPYMPVASPPSSSPTTDTVPTWLAEQLFEHAAVRPAMVARAAQPPREVVVRPAGQGGLFVAEISPY